MKAHRKPLLRAGQLAERAGVSLATIKHYVNEGLIPKPLKTGKTMAYYDESCVERIKLIKKLQKEKFLPLEVIRRVIDSGSTYEEELELGQAILKSHKVRPDARPVSEANIERRTGYSLDKIHLLEREGLIMPARRGGGTYYDSIDCAIIEVMRRREEVGVPFDHSVETVRLYRDAMERAVREDIRLFAKNLLGDVSAKQAVKLLTEADDSLDTFVFLIRQKFLRVLSQAAIGEMNGISEKLAMLSFLPVRREELPESPPPEPWLNVVYHFCTADYRTAASVAGRFRVRKDGQMYAAAEVLATLLNGDTKSALRMVEEHLPKPSVPVLPNAVAALAVMASVGEATGFSTPMYLAKKGLGYLKRMEASRGTDMVTRLLSLYVCGAIYTMLPDIFDTHDAGIKMLMRLARILKSRKLRLSRMPEWLASVVIYEMAPAVEIRANRFIAECFLQRGDRKSAAGCLERMIELAEIDDEHAQWARLKRLETRSEGS